MCELFINNSQTRWEGLCDISVTGAWSRIDGSVTAAEAHGEGGEVTHNHQ